MRVKVFIVTYNNDIVLEQNLEKLYSSDLVEYDYMVYIINNHSTIKTKLEYPNLTILDNTLRPDFSTGHLSRNWNQALINGFKDLDNPDSDLVILMQNDTFVKPFWFSNLIESHKTYDFIQLGTGDQIMSFNANAVKQIGLFDERFCTIAFQEADYFMMAYMLHRDKISINDCRHYRIHNPLSDVNEIYLESEYSLNKKFHNTAWHEYNRQLFYLKWNNLNPEHWNFTKDTPITLPKINRYYYYPYFETKINTLIEQNYLVKL
jgi:hypothetical protein